MDIGQAHYGDASPTKLRKKINRWIEELIVNNAVIGNVSMRLDPTKTDYEVLTDEDGNMRLELENGHMDCAVDSLSRLWRAGRTPGAPKPGNPRPRRAMNSAPRCLRRRPARLPRSSRWPWRWWRTLSVSPIGQRRDMAWISTLSSPKCGDRRTRFCAIRCSGTFGRLVLRGGLVHLLPPRVVVRPHAGGEFVVGDPDPHLGGDWIVTMIGGVAANAMSTASAVIQDRTGCFMVIISSVVTTAARRVVVTTMFQGASHSRHNESPLTS